MWIKSYSKVYQNIKKEDVWQIWSDVDHYTQWHDDLDYCQLYSKRLGFRCSSIPLTGDLETFFLRKTLKYNEYSCGFSQSERFNLTGHWAL